MGIGDDIMATGFARGASERGRKIAFGDGKRIIWGPHSEMVFRHNPNVARSLSDAGIEWVHYHKGNRIYNSLGNGRWIWNYDFRPEPGEFFFSFLEKERTVRRHRSVLIEPNVPWNKSVAANKDWGVARYQKLVDALRLRGYGVFQTSHGQVRLRDVVTIPVIDFRTAAAALAGFDACVVPEGGLHHAAAAVGVPAVVLYGGFIPPEVTGYEGQLCLTGGAEACGSLNRCDHCAQAMSKISVEEVLSCVEVAITEKERKSAGKV